MDIFAGSNTTGEAAEDNQRKWLSFEIMREYAAVSALRFTDSGEKDQLKSLYSKLLDPNAFDIEIGRQEKPVAESFARVFRV